MSLAPRVAANRHSPRLCAIPRSAKRLLIDGGLLHYEASIGGFEERYRRGESPHTVNVWWARRPYAAMRALVFASLCPSKSTGAKRVLSQLSRGMNPPPPLVEAARSLLTRSDCSAPRVLDMFGGGGTIALEAARLGAEAHSIDSNQLSVFVQKSILEQFESGSPRLPTLVKSSGERVLKRLAADTAHLFPMRESVFGYLWTYKFACRKCGFGFFLSKRPWLTKKRGKYLALVQLQERCSNEQAMEIQQVGSDHALRPVWRGRNATAVCPKCQHANSEIKIDGARDALAATISLGRSSGKTFARPTKGLLPEHEQILAFEAAALQDLGAELPGTELPRWSGIVNPALYGISTHADFLNPRQRAVLVALIRSLWQEYEYLAASESEAVAKSVVGLLSGLIDQLIDWNCRLSMWISQNEQVGRAFSGPGVPMLWDYVETDPLQHGPANLWGKLARIVAGTISMCEIQATAEVRRGFAQELPYPADYFDAVVTDPPYYDNIYYNALADFFYSWKRLLLAKLDPHLFAAPATDSSRELVASTFRSGSPEAAHEQYCENFSEAIAEAERVLKADGVFSLVYSHSSIPGWEAVVRAYRPTNLRITSVQPLSIERKARPRAMTSEAVNTCVVFVAHRGAGKKQGTSLERLCANLRSIIKDFVISLRDAGWRDDDVGLAAFAQGVGLLANVRQVSGADGDRAALAAFELVVRELVPTFCVQTRKSM